MGAVWCESVVGKTETTGSSGPGRALISHVTFICKIGMRTVQVPREVSGGRMHESISAQANGILSPEWEGNMVCLGGDGRCRKTEVWR